MGVPKKRTSSMRRDRRRAANFKITPANVTQCPQAARSRCCPTAPARPAAPTRASRSPRPRSGAMAAAPSRPSRWTPWGATTPPAPSCTARLTQRARDMPVMLVGPEAPGARGARAPAGRSRLLPVTVRHASEVVAMDDHPGQAMRRKKRQLASASASSWWRAARPAAWSRPATPARSWPAPSSCWGGCPRVERPAIVSVLPAVAGRARSCSTWAPTSTASRSTSCSSRSWARSTRGACWGWRGRGWRCSPTARRPRRAPTLTRAAAAALRHARGIDFRGYCEGRDLLTGDARRHRDRRLHRQRGAEDDGGDGPGGGRAGEGVAPLHAALGGGGRLLAEERLGADQAAASTGARSAGAPLLGVDGVGFIDPRLPPMRHAIRNAVARVRAAADAHAHRGDRSRRRPGARRCSRACRAR